MCDNQAEAGLDDHEASNNRDNSDEQEEADSSVKQQGNYLREADEDKKHRKKSKDFQQCHF